MTQTKINRIVAAFVYFTSLIVYLITLSRTVVFWVVGEYLASAYLLQVPHPPGAPFLLLVGRVFSMLSFNPDVAYRMHTISALSGAIVVMFLYLISVKLIVRFRGMPGTTIDNMLVYGASAIGALSLAFCTSYWNNSIEFEAKGTAMFFVAFVLWLALQWSENADKPNNEKYIFLIAYLLGLCVGVRPLALLMIFPVGLIIYFTKYEFSQKSFIRFNLFSLAAFGIIYPGIVKWLPSMFAGEVGGFQSDLLQYVPFIIVAAAVYYAYKSWKTGKKMLHVACVSFLLIVIGYSTYVEVIIRANVNSLPINENDPSVAERFVSYMNREQYGEAPVFKRRYSQEPQHAPTWQNYSSDMDFFLRYQMDHMYIRYVLRNFVGAAGDEQDDGVSWKYTLGIPFFLGLLGVYYHFKKDWKMGLTFLGAFLLLGFILAFYFNMQDPQPRERDYFYAGSYFVFSLWIGFGIVAIVDFLRKKLREEKYFRVGSTGLLAAAFLFVPVNLIRINWHDHDRSKNYVAWDYSYDLLQSCEPDAILFTNGDNDTFPLWYLQSVEGVRRDIRVANLSLINTPWYIDQLKNDTPFGAKKVPISLTDDQIANIQPREWKARQMTLDVPKAAVEQFAGTTDIGKQGTLVDTSILNSGKITFTFPSTVKFGSISAIRVQDIMVYDIIRTNAWRRPIYFAVTSTPDSKIGLDRYMRMDGLAMKLIPYQAPTDDGVIVDSIFSANLYNTPKGFYKEFHRGYKYRGLSDSTVYFDENIRRLTMNYRNAFLRLALYHLYTARDNAKAVQALDSMDAKLPRNVIPMDYRLMFDVANFYNQAGAKKQYTEYITELQGILERKIQSNPHEQLSQYNPYTILLAIYEANEEYQKAIDVLNKINEVYAGTPGLEQQVKSRIAQVQAEMALKASQNKDTLASQTPNK
ncbi:MAG: DUF2723 domain-containing protein [Bacteroidota bacterium]|nr:DUF2723 domain-containing protein [Bacteroidota bacterium]